MPPTSKKTEPHFLSVAEAAEIANLSKDTIRNMIDRGDLPSYRPVRGRILIDREELIAAIRASQGRTVRKGRGRRSSHV